MAEDNQEHSIQFTQVISSVSDNGKDTDTVSSFAPVGARALIEDKDVDVDPVTFTVNSSLELRRSLEKSDRRYSLIKLLATGGYGRIFLAEDKVLGRKAVVKSLKEELLDKPEIVKKFITEAKLNARLDHPSIVTVFSLDTDNTDGLHLAMQLINGITLKEYLQRTLDDHLAKKFNQRATRKLLQERLEIFLHICDAIDYSHSKGVIHCDIKPENIMIGRYGEVYVMDWGIAAPIGVNRKGHLDGTPAYMPPETLREGVTNRQTDVFAMGMLLNEIVTLRNAITGDSVQDIIRRICLGDFEPSTSIVPGMKISKQLRAIIEMGRASDPSERYKTIKSMADDVRHCLFNEEVSACPDSLMMKVSRFMYRHRVGTLVCMFALILCLAGVTVSALMFKNRLIQQVSLAKSREVNQRNNMHRITEEFEQVFSDMQLLGENLSMTLGMEHEQPSFEIKEAPYYLNADYAPDSMNQPPDMVKTPFYKNPITLEYGSYFVPEGFSESAFYVWKQRIRSLHSIHVGDFLSNVRTDDNRIYSKTENLRMFIKQGALLRRITYVLENGLVFRYPGTYEENFKESSDFLDNWGARAMKSPENMRNYVWSLPHPDTDGHVVVSCWMPILNIDGARLGMVGMDLCYHSLVDNIYKQAKDEAFKASYYLINQTGQQIFCSDALIAGTEDSASIHRGTLELKKFAYPDVLSKIKNTVNTQFTIELEGKKMRVAWSRIKQTNWILIRILPADVYTWFDNLDNQETEELFTKKRDDYKG